MCEFRKREKIGGEVRKKQIKEKDFKILKGERDWKSELIRLDNIMCEIIGINCK
jgi:hypothetical protein